MTEFSPILYDGVYRLLLNGIDRATIRGNDLIALALASEWLEPSCDEWRTGTGSLVEHSPVEGTPSVCDRARLKELGNQLQRDGLSLVFHDRIAEEVSGRIIAFELARRLKSFGFDFDYGRISNITTILDPGFNYQFLPSGSDSDDVLTVIGGKELIAVALVFGYDVSPGLGEGRPSTLWSGHRFICYNATRQSPTVTSEETFDVMNRLWRNPDSAPNVTDQAIYSIVCAVLSYEKELQT